MTPNAGLPYDLDDLSDFPIWIQEWQGVVQRQAERIESDYYWADGYLLLVAAHHVHVAARAYAVHDPTGEILEACDLFKDRYPRLDTLRNMVMHFDEYYRGNGRDPQARGHRIFRYGMSRHNGDIHLVIGWTDAGSCNLTALARDSSDLAAVALSAGGPGESWLMQMIQGKPYSANSDD